MELGGERLAARLAELCGAGGDAGGEGGGEMFCCHCSTAVLGVRRAGADVLGCPNEETCGVGGGLR